jgi:hypothetical protein
MPLLSLLRIGVSCSTVVDTRLLTETSLSAYVCTMPACVCLSREGGPMLFGSWSSYLSALRSSFRLELTRMDAGSC